MTAPTPPPRDPESAHETPDSRETDHPTGDDHAAADIDNEPPG